MTHTASNSTSTATNRKERKFLANQMRREKKNRINRVAKAHQMLKKLVPKGDSYLGSGGRKLEDLCRQVREMPHWRLYSPEVQKLFLEIERGTADAERFSMEEITDVREAFIIGSSYIFSISGWGKFDFHHTIKYLLHEKRKDRREEIGEGRKIIKLPFHKYIGDLGHSQDGRFRKKADVYFEVEPSKYQKYLDQIALAKKQGNEVTANRVGPCLGDGRLGVDSSCPNFQNNWHWQEHLSGGDQYFKYDTCGLTDTDSILAVCDAEIL